MFVLKSMQCKLETFSCSEITVKNINKLSFQSKSVEFANILIGLKVI